MSGLSTKIQAGFILGALMTACFGTQARAETTVTLASAQNSLGSLPIYMARQKNFFRDEGVAIQIIDFKGGAPAVQALVAGSVDMCICAADHAIRLRSRGQPGVIVVALTEYHGYGLVALSTAPATDLASLKTRRIGITSPGSLTDNTIRYFIAKLNLDPDSDFQIISVGTGGPMRAAIETGAVTAGMLTTPDVQAALAANGKFKIVQDFRTLQYPALDLVALQSWVDKHPEAAQGLTRAVIHAEQLIQQGDPALAAGLAEMFPQLDPALRIDLAKDAQQTLAKDGTMSPAGYDRMVDMLKASDPDLKPIPFADIVAVQKAAAK